MDMFSDAGVLGIFCIFAILLIKEVLPLIARKPKENKVLEINAIEHTFRKINECVNKVPELERMLRDVSFKMSKSLDMHEKYDSDGRPIWYIKEELEENIKMQRELLNRQNVVLDKIATAIEGQTQLIEKMLESK